MKKMFFLLIAANGALSVYAQKQDTTRTIPRQAYVADTLMSRWAIDLNVLGGVLSQDLNMVNTAGNYTDAVSTNIGPLDFSKGRSIGFSAQIGYFFDKKAHFGLGTGLMYFHQWGRATLENFRVDYKSVDGRSDVFRQVITANRPIVETQKISQFNIPLVLKYKTRFSKGVGFSADAGVLFNFSANAKYEADASFDYEAIYQHVTRHDGNIYTVYDPSPNYSHSDLVITKDQYNKTHADGNVAAYFNQQRALGYNVGLDQQPTNNKGTVEYSDVSVGFIAQPSLNFYVSDQASVNVGLYYIYQSFNNDVNGGTRLTDKVGEYNSVLTSVDNVASHNFGVNAGVRVMFGNKKDTDKDGIPDKTDACPTAWGLSHFQGCPDKDNDGIQDSKDDCPDVYGSTLFRGCPDSDGDGVTDATDACPNQAGPARFRGCPDTDSDGVPDSEDKCPTIAGLPMNMGCPDVKKTQETYKPLKDITEPILFELGDVKIQEASMPLLTEAILELRNNESAFIVIDGHTDNIGTDEINDVLSFKRANTVKRYLTQMGADPTRMVAVGHGSKEPIASNATEEGRAKNRRVIMSLKHRAKR